MRAGVPRLAVMLAVASTLACAGAAQAQEEVTSKTDGAKEKLDESLQAKVDAGSTETVPVLVTVSGDPSKVEALLTGDHTATSRRTSLVVGRVPAQTATKVASLANVVSVGLIQKKQTGQPVDRPEDHHRISRAQLRKHHDEHEKTDVPYDEAPRLKGSNFERLKQLNVL